LKNLRTTSFYSILKDKYHLSVWKIEKQFLLEYSRKGKKYSQTMNLTLLVVDWSMEERENGNER